MSDDLAALVLAAIEETERIAQAANDPAAVLRGCVADRKLIADLLTEKHLVVDGDGWYTCAVATEERDGGKCYNELAGNECGCGRDGRVARRLAIVAEGYDITPP